MSYHVVDVDTASCELTCRRGQLVLISADGVKTLPVEDISSVIINGFDVRLHKQLLIELGKAGAGLIICEKYKPVSILLPANRSTDTLLTRKLAGISERMRAALWRSLVNAKCQNQSELATHLAPCSQPAQSLATFAKSARLDKEAICAKYHWAAFRLATKETDFSRKRGQGRFNPFLDYGYAVLLNLVLQRLLAVGLDPQFGFGHAVRERAAPLAYDVMEPFRPIVDFHLAQLVIKLGDEPLEMRAFKEAMSKALERKYSYRNRKLDLAALVEANCRSLRKAVLTANPRVFRPWTAKNSKWVG
jgi:CRISP-associated protein Cas1